MALVLAAFGIFGVLAFSVSQRTREFGIRMARGAHSSAVLRMAVSNGLKMITVAELALYRLESESAKFWEQLGW